MRTGLELYSGQPFKFKVIASNYQGDSQASDSVRILAAEVPSAPPQPTKESQSKTAVSIRWTQTTYNGGVPIESYNIYVKIGDTSYVLTTTHTDLIDLSYTHTVDPADIGKTFSFQVSAVNEVGESARSV